MQKSSLANCTDMNDNIITELEKFKNKLEEIPLADIREIVDELNSKLNAIEDTIDIVLEGIDKEIDFQNKFNIIQNKINSL
jgi:hypothetical protein